MGNVRVGGSTFTQTEINQARSFAQRVAQGKPITGIPGKKAFDRLRSVSAEFRRDVQKGVAGRLDKKLPFEADQQLGTLAGLKEVRRQEDFRGQSISPSERQKIIARTRGEVVRGERRSSPAVLKTVALSRKEINKPGGIPFQTGLAPKDQKFVSPPKLSVSRKVQRLINEFNQDRQKFIREKGKATANLILDTINLPQKTFVEQQKTSESLKAALGERIFFEGKPIQDLTPQQLGGSIESVVEKFIPTEDLTTKFPFGGIDEVVRRKQSEIDSKSRIEINRAVGELKTSFKQQLISESGELFDQIQTDLNEGKIDFDQAQRKLELGNNKILTKINNDFNKKVQKNIEPRIENITSKAQEFVDLKSKEALKAQALQLIGLNIITGAALGAAGAIPVAGRIIGATVTGAAIINTPEFAKELRTNPAAFAIQASSFALGGFLGADAIRGLKGQTSLTGTTLKGAKTSFNKLIGVSDKFYGKFMEQQAKLLRDKKASARVFQKLKQKNRFEALNELLESQQKEGEIQKMKETVRAMALELKKNVQKLNPDEKVRAVEDFKRLLLELQNKKLMVFEVENPAKINQIQRLALQRLRQAQSSTPKTATAQSLRVSLILKQKQKQRQVQLQLEKQDPKKSLGQRYRLAQKLNLKQKQLQNQLQKEKQRLVQMQKQKQPQRQLQRQREKVRQLQRQLQNQKQLQLQKQGQRQRQLQRQRQRQRQKQFLRVGTKLKRPFKSQTNKKKPLKLKSLARPEKGYDTFVKSKGKFKKMNQASLKKQTARGLGAFLVDHSLSASFKIKKSGKSAEQSKLSFPNTYFRSNKNKFRPSKKNKKVFVEKRKFRLDKTREVKKIQAEKLVKSLVKRKLKRLKSFIPRRRK